MVQGLLPAVDSAKIFASARKDASNNASKAEEALQGAR